MRNLLLVLAACGSSPTPVAKPEAKGLVVMGELERGVPTYTITLLADHRGCTFTDNNGYEDGDLRVPIGEQVRLQVSHWEPEGTPAANEPVSVSIGSTRVSLKNHSADSIHFIVESDGTYRWACNDVPLTMIVMKKPDLEALVHVADEAAHPTSPAGKVLLGQKLYTRKGCMACHSVDGSPRVGPSWKGIWGTTVKGADGSERSVDQAYVKESILTPQAFTVVGFPPGTMPAFDGQLSEIELASLVAYIQSLQ